MPTSRDYRKRDGVFQRVRHQTPALGHRHELSHEICVAVLCGHAHCHRLEALGHAADGAHHRDAHIRHVGLARPARRRAACSENSRPAKSADTLRQAGRDRSALVDRADRQTPCATAPRRSRLTAQSVRFQHSLFSASRLLDSLTLTSTLRSYGNSGGGVLRFAACSNANAISMRRGSLHARR